MYEPQQGAELGVEQIGFTTALQTFSLKNQIEYSHIAEMQITEVTEQF